MIQMTNLIDFDKTNKTEEYLIGTDEAGRGPAAGPVFAAAVCFIKEPCGILLTLNDSKKLTEKKREELFEEIIKNSIYSIQYSTVEDIEKMNILNASLNAMNRACIDVISKLNNNNVEIFVDGNKLIKNFKHKQKFIIKGDSKSASIAAASILAKVSRDRLMKELDKDFPQYKWIKNKGYLSKAHIEAIKEYGATIHHRKLFLRKILAETSPTQLSLIQ